MKKRIIQLLEAPGKLQAELRALNQRFDGFVEILRTIAQVKRSVTVTLLGEMLPAGKLTELGMTMSHIRGVTVCAPLTKLMSKGERTTFRFWPQREMFAGAWVVISGAAHVIDVKIGVHSQFASAGLGVLCKMPDTVQIGQEVSVEVECDDGRTEVSF